MQWNKTFRPTTDHLPQRDKSPSPQEDEGELSEGGDDGVLPKAKTRLSKILSNVPIPKNSEESDERDTTPEVAAANEVLGTVKFDAGVVGKVESSRSAKCIRVI